MKAVGGLFKIDSKNERIQELETLMSDPDFWNNREHSEEVTKEISSLKRAVKDWVQMKSELQSMTELIELAVMEEDNSLADEIIQGVESIQEQYGTLEFQMFFSGEQDHNNCFLDINAGAGGTEACDWASMLQRMYLRFAEQKGYDVEIVDILPGEEAGLKNCTLHICGDQAYGHLRSEIGVHRLVRISPFDANKRRHTSFASVYVYPEVDDNLEVDINPNDLRIDTYRSQGAGGQHVNTTDSAVRITHLPTNIVVQCQNERSQIKNRSTAMKILKSRLYEYFKNERDEERKQKENEKKDITWGSQIRSYVFHPYTMVKDHRTNQEIGDANGVMDGRLESLIMEYLKWSVGKN